jgi:HEAT repeat protein
MAVAIAAAVTHAAAQGPEPGRRWALIVTGDREGPRNAAARDIAGILRRDYGYGSESIQELPGATRAALYAALDSLRSRVRRSDSLFVYMAARTTSMRGKLMSDQLLLADSNEREPWTVLDISEVLDRLISVRAAATLLMMDSCAQVDWAYGSRTKGSSMGSQSQSSYSGGSPFQVITGCPSDLFGQAAAEALGGAGAQADQRRFGAKALAARMNDVRKNLRAAVSGDGPFLFERVETALTLSQLHRSNSPVERQRAINEIVRTTLSDSTANVAGVYEVFTKIARDKTDASSVRVAALRAMGLLEVPSRERDLAAVIRDETDTALVDTGISALERLRTPAAVAQLEQLVDAPSPEARASAIRALGRMDARGSLPRVLKRVVTETASDPLIAALEVVPVLSTTPHTQAVTSVLDLLRRPLEPPVERAAIGALGLLRTPRAEQLLIARLTVDRPEIVRAAAAVALSSLTLSQGAAREEALIKALSDPASSVRESAAFSLGRLKARTATGPLLSLLRSANADVSVRAAAAAALGEIGATEAKDALLDGLDDDSAHVRGASATALGKVGDRSVLKTLRDLEADDKDGYVRLAAANAIRTLSSTSEAVEDDLESTDPSRRRDAIGRLGASTRPDAAALIIKRLADPDPDVVAAAIIELTRMKGSDPTSALIAELKRPDDSVEGTSRRRGAALALGGRESQAGLEPLLAAARDKDLQVRSAALAALANYDDPRIADALREAEALPGGVLLHSAADAWTAYGNTLYARERPEDAARAFVNALRIHEQLFGSNDPQIAVDLNNLGVVLLRTGRTEEAEAALQRALVIRERVLGPSDPETATSLINLGLVYSSQKSFERAEPLYLRALRIREATLGPNDMTMVPLLEQLARMYASMGRKSEADQLARRAAYIRGAPASKK